MSRFAKARKAIESLYDGRCTVVEYQQVKNPTTKRTEAKEVEVLKDIPCRLSYKTVAKNEAGNVSEVVQVTKLFIGPEVTVKAGSKIIVTQYNKTTEFKSSGVPANHSNHQEITLDLFERWA